MWAEVAFANHDTRFSGTCKSFAFLIPGCKSQPVAFSSGLSRYFSPLLLSKFHALGHSLYVQRITNLIFQLGVFMCFMRYFLLFYFFFNPRVMIQCRGRLAALAGLCWAAKHHATDSPDSSWQSAVAAQCISVPHHPQI